LKTLSLDDLLEVEIFNPEARSAARKEQKLTDTAAALFVITQEDIRRGGITSLPEALRMVPGVEVARANSHKWAITSRGFNGVYASKLLVMIDGRTVYSPLYSGVIWNVQDVLMEDVERIEVIRGPGASLWGANAVNGIINIITKSASDTEGNLLSTYIGKGEERGILGMRHGGTLDNGISYRVYGKFSDHNSFIDEQGVDQQDSWQMKRSGFRMDWKATNDDNLTVQGDVYEGFTKEISVFETNKIDHANFNGFNLLARWQRNLKDGNIILQTYYDRNHQNILRFEELRDTYDFDFQHSWQRNDTQEFIWGLGYRYTQDDIKNSPTLIANPKTSHDSLFSAFIQGEFMLLPEELRLTLGSKFEQNDYTGFEFQPSIRLLWTLNDKHSIWAAISRAVRTPSRTDVAMNAKFESIQTQLLGNNNFQSETVQAYEFGYRFNLKNSFLFDMSMFYNDYKKLRSIEPIGFNFFPTPPAIFQMDNKMNGESYGIEIATSWQVSETWKLIMAYSYIDIQLHLEPSSQARFKEQEEGDSPHNKASLRSLLTLPYNMELDATWYYVDNVPSQNTANYNRFDVRFGWQARKNLELSLGARNLFDNQHQEFSNQNSANTIITDEVRRAFYLQMKYRF